MMDKLLAYGKAYRLPVGVGVLVLLALSGLYRWVVYPVAPSEAVPAETAMVFCFDQAKNKDSGMDSDSTTSFLQYFPSLSQDFLFMQQLSAKRPVIYTVDLLSKGQYALAAIVNGGDKALLDSLHQHYHDQTSEYLGCEVHQLALPQGTLSYARHRNLLLLGRLPLQVERQLAQLDEGQDILSKLKNGTKGIVFTENLPAFLNGFWKGEALAASRSWADYEAALAFHWVSDSLGINIKGEGLPISNHSPADSSSYLVLPYLPAELAWCHWSHFETPEKGESLFDKYIRSWSGNDKAVFQMPLPGSIAENQVLLLRTLDPLASEQKLESFGEEEGALESYSFQLFTVRRLFAEGLLASLGIDMVNPYTVVLGDYVAFSPSRAALEQTARAYLLSQHLASSGTFQSVWPAIANPSSTGWIFFNGMLGRSRLQEWLSDLEQQSLHLLTAYPNWAGSWNAEGAFQLFGLEAKNSAQNSLLTQLWAAPLQAKAASPPYPYPDGGFLIQDKANRLYFFNEKGEERWVYPLPDSMIGAPKWVDYFGEGAPCIAFTTSSRAYVLNPGGRPVGRYPQAWPSPAISPLLVADIEGEGTFRLFVGTAAGIYGFTQEGQPLPAWSPFTQLDSSVQLTMRYQQFGDEDYMTILTQKGTLYNLQRDGQARFGYLPLGKQYGVAFSSPPYLQADKNQQRIAVGDEKGFVHAVNLQGAHFRLNVLPGSSSARFLFRQILGDERRDYLSWDERELALHFYEGQAFKKHLSYRFPSPAAEVFIVDWSGQPYIGWRSASTKQVHLLDLEGREVTGFPLAGSTAFSTQQLPDGSTMLVVGYGQRLYGYLLPRPLR